MLNFGEWYDYIVEGVFEGDDMGGIGVNVVVENNV